MRVSMACPGSMSARLMLFQNIFVLKKIPTSSELLAGGLNDKTFAMKEKRKSHLHQFHALGAEKKGLNNSARKHNLVVGPSDLNGYFGSTLSSLMHLTDLEKLE